jgi:hypothetical protein
VLPFVRIRAMAGDTQMEALKSRPLPPVDD